MKILSFLFPKPAPCWICQVPTEVRHTSRRRWHIRCPRASRMFTDSIASTRRGAIRAYNAYAKGRKPI